MHLKRLKEFRCENCGESFATTDQIKRHFESKHFGEEPKSKLYIASTKPKKKKNKANKEDKEKDLKLQCGNSQTFILLRFYVKMI